MASVSSDVEILLREEEDLDLKKKERKKKKEEAEKKKKEEAEKKKKKQLYKIIDNYTTYYAFVFPHMTFIRINCINLNLFSMDNSYFIKIS